MAKKYKASSKIGIQRIFLDFIPTNIYIPVSNMFHLFLLPLEVLIHYMLIVEHHNMNLSVQFF